jgi:hypothetical protein
MPDRGWQDENGDWVQPAHEDLAKRDEEWNEWVNENYGRKPDDFYDPTWNDQEAEEQLACWVRDNIPPQRVYFDDKLNDFACRCARYQRDGKCTHLWRYRPERTITFSDDWKECF